MRTPPILKSRRVGILGLTLAMLASLLAIAAGPPVGAQTQCAKLSVAPATLSGGSSGCYYVVTEAFGSWDKACEGVGGSLNCQNLESGKHKVDVFVRKPWKKLTSYNVTVPPAGSTPGSGCAELSVAPATLSGGSSSCYYVVIEAFGSWDKACEGVGGSLNCQNLESGKHKVDVFVRKPWKKFTSYNVIVPPGGTGGNSGDPDIDRGQYGHDFDYDIDFVENFDDGLGNWNIIDMDNDPMHQVGNGGVDGRRWAAWYNDHTERTLRFSNDRLLFGGRYTNETDPGREPFSFGGTTSRFDEHKFYTSFLTTWDRERGNVAADQNRTWGPGTFAEMRVSFAQMRTRGFRLSFWFMPSGGNAGNAYNGVASDGVEIDIFEYDPSPGRQNDLAMKVAGNGSADSTPNGIIEDPVSSLNSGFHTIGLLWTEDRLVWYVDGVQQQVDRINVPDVDHYLLVTREMNSGVSNAEARPPGIPADGGLWADGDVWRNSVWIDRNNVNSDRAIIDYVKVWDVS